MQALDEVTNEHGASTSELAAINSLCATLGNDLQATIERQASLELHYAAAEQSKHATGDQLASLHARCGRRAAHQQARSSCSTNGACWETCSAPGS